MELYTQLAIFQRDATRIEISFENSDHSEQDILHSLARKLGLEYENSLRLRQVTISKPRWVESRHHNFFPHALHSSLSSTVGTPENGNSCGQPLRDLTSPQSSKSPDLDKIDFVGTPDTSKVFPITLGQFHRKFVFVSDPAGSPGKEPSRGRRGRLDQAAREESNAVKAVGACWKCRYLRKKVKKVLLSGWEKETY